MNRNGAILLALIIGGLAAQLPAIAARLLFSAG